MPLFKGLSSKSTPRKAIDYITREDKAAFVSVRNLFEDEDYAEQFADTIRRFGKGKKFDERKYYHFKLSCARKDNVSPEQAHLYAQELAAILFPDDECVIATHTDTKTVHSHIIVNAVNPITGKKLRITESDYTRMKDEANRLGSEFGYSTIDFRKKAQNKRTTEESHIILKGGTSWKEDLREVIEEAKRVSSTQEEFISHLALYSVSVTRSKTEYSFLHPQKKKAIRGLKLGNNYTKRRLILSLNRIDTGEAATPLAQLQEMNEQKRTDLESSLLKEALAISNDKCNSLIDKQNTLIKDLTTKVRVLESENDYNANRLSESVSNAVKEIRNLQAETRSLNNRVATETSQAIKRTTTTLESELRKTIQTQSAEVLRKLRKKLTRARNFWSPRAKN